MPAPVDHSERRDRIADIVSDIISREGMDAVTIRQVAAAAGYSTTIVTHYFASKRELLLHTYQAAAASAQRRVDAVMELDPLDLQGYIEALLPLDEASLREWRVYFAFWQLAAIDPDFAEEQRRGEMHAREGIVRILEARHGAGRGLSPGDVEVAGRRLLTLLLGIAVQAMFDPTNWSAERQKRFLGDELRAILGGATSATGHAGQPAG